MTVYIVSQSDSEGDEYRIEGAFSTAKLAQAFFKAITQGLDKDERNRFSIGPCVVDDPTIWPIIGMAYPHDERFN